MTPRTCSQRTLCSRSHFCSSIFNGLFLSFQHSGINIFSAFSSINLGGSFEIQQLNWSCNLWNCSLSILIFNHAGFCLSICLTLYSMAIAKTCTTFVIYISLEWNQADSFSSSHFHFEKTFFVYTDSISNLIFVSDFSSVFILIVFLLLFPSEIPPQLQILTNKEYFQFILQNSFHQLFSWIFICFLSESIKSFFENSFKKLFWSFSQQVYNLFSFFIIVTMNRNAFLFSYQFQFSFQSFYFSFRYFFHHLAI